MPKSIKKILWATDFSDEANEALLYADFFARTFKAELLALHVLPDFSSALYNVGSLKGELGKMVIQVKNDVKKKLEIMQEKKEISFKILVKEGKAAVVIKETADKEKVDLIVMGKKGQSAIEKLFIGSVTNQVLRCSPAPVLVTKKKSGKPRLKNILVPTDFSEHEERERDYAWMLAKKLNASLTLLHVMELHDYEFSPRVIEETFDKLMNRLKKRKKREKEGFKVKEDVTKAVNAAGGIVDYAETHKLDMIVMSTYVHSKLERFFLGSTTEKVIGYSHIPVFAIPPECYRK